MGYPTITVEIAFASTPLATTPTWTDVTAYVRSIPLIRRGRQNALTSIEAGEGVVVLDNRDRRFDPTYTSGAYYPNVLPAKKIRISAVWSGTTYRLFTGYIDGWPPSWEASNQYSEVAIHCTDAFRYFSQVNISATLGAEFSQWAVGTLLDTLGWPAADRAITGGVNDAYIKAVTLVNKSALQHFQDLAATEGGLFFMDGRGYAVWHGRHFRLLQTVSTTSQATFGDGGGSELPYQELEPSYDDALLYNDVHVTADGGVEKIAGDSTSQAAYFKRSYTRTGLLYGDTSGLGGSTPDTEALGMAGWLLYAYKNPTFRFDRIVLEGGYSDSLWPQMLGREISDRITVKRRPPPSGSAAISKEVWIEAVEHRITDITATFLRWQTSWQLSEASTTSWWTLDSATLSVLGTSTRLAY